MQKLQDQAREEFDYDPIVGIVTRRRDGHLGYDNGHGYLLIKFDGRNISAHRLAWLIHYGQFPDGNLDHVNGQKKDNRISNLRVATYQQNNANRRGWKNSTSGIKGVGIKNGRWMAQITVDRKNKHLGYFDTKEQAAKAYAIAAAANFGEFARTA